MKPEKKMRSELATVLWRFRREFVWVGVLSMLANLLMLTPTIYMLQVYDRVLASHSELTLLFVSLLALAMLAVMSTAEWLRSRLLVRAGMRLDALLSTRVFHASFEAYLNEADQSPRRVFTDLVEIRQFLTGTGILALFDAPWTPIYLAVLFLLHPLLGAAAVLFALVQFALVWFGHRRSVRPNEEAGLALQEASAYMQGKLRNAEVVEALGMLGPLRTQWLRRHEQYVHKHEAAQALTHRISAWSKFIRYSQQSLALGTGALLVIDGQMTPGGMIAGNVLMSRALAPIDMLVGAWRSFSGALAAYRRLEDLLERYPERDPALRRVTPRGELQLRGVVATAQGRAEPILKGIDLDLPAGTVTVLVGPSGSGKSTLARVMLGIWPQVSGEVLLDGLPVSGWDRNELGEHLGYLPQDVELFEGTLAENIARFGEIDSAGVIEAAQRAGLHDLILHFPKGYDTPIGPGGGVLTGGQRQRIGLARALYHDPAVLVLDEPNSNLDEAGEAALLEAVRGCKARGRTVLLISHRPTALAVADRLVVMGDGRIVAAGPRDAVVQALQQAQARAAVSAAAAPAPG
ncbi:ATP-binding cassette subfamily C exporter for protease/lipase [Tibeticola sediminis]|uniref:ATP-binding cassette subfamily C exporter for protease/lipase n=1 Tax=Tibeticola sediminis TaxID=1917811 RepID=A0A3N4UR06_9BURK|nr:type I secretion system permease/ATPase [Tibeticola sediminis]RPE73126.1 ATP-binding cassette subfamily C exporter for protease/lipase [Tibeticola sediminis]